MLDSLPECVKLINAEGIILYINKAGVSLQQFAHIASHVLKEPLRKISVFTELLQKELDKGNVGKAKEFAGRVASSTPRMNAFIESVLKFASIESHKAESVPSI